MNGKKILIVEVVGRLFMEAVDCPVQAIDKLLKNYTLGRNVNAIFVDFHAEATSEKIAFGRFLDGRAVGVVGSHTHVATADEQILPAGTAYQTDAGMCGPHSGVIGRDADAVLKSFLDGRPRRFEIAEGDVRLNGCLITCDETQKKAVAVARFSLAQ